MKKTIIATFVCLIGILFVNSSLEARHHHRRSNRVEVGIRANPCYDAYVVRRYAQPVVVQQVQPVIVQQTQPVIVQQAQPVVQTAPVCYTPVYVTPSPVVYQEEVYVAPAPSRPLFGFSFSWLFH